MNYTPNYQLSQWEAGDPVLRADFNADNQKIEAAIKALEGAISGLSAQIPEIVTGTYTGDGAAERIIPLPFAPKAVYLCTESGITYFAYSGVGHYWGGLVLDNAPIAPNGLFVAEITGSGLKVFFSGSATGSLPFISSTNVNETNYHYIALSW